MTVSTHSYFEPVVLADETGLARCAERLAARLGRDNVLPADIEALAEAGLLGAAEVRHTRRGARELFDLTAVDALSAEQVAAVVGARLAWTAPTVTFGQACARLRWTRGELARVVVARRIARGRFGRFARTDIDELAAETATRFARRMLEPGRAVVLDTETTSLGGAVCEIAVIDARTGATLLDTLVNPGVPIDRGAFAVHGICDDAVTAPGVPTWRTVYKRLLNVTKGRIVLAYNAEYDYRVIAADCRRHRLRRRRLGNAARWADVMMPRCDYERSIRLLPNGGGHRALGDVQQTRLHLLRMAEDRGFTNSEVPMGRN